LTIYKKSRSFKLDQAIWDILLKIKELRKGVTHLAVTKWLVSELYQTGINAEYFPISTIDNLKPINREKSSSEREYDFLSYIPSNNASFYGEGENIHQALSIFLRC
jgi:hypothetical protein